MLSKSRIWNCNFVLILLVLQTAVLYIESYEFKCPSQASWRLRAHVKCNSTMKYFCLYNNVAGKYVEGCDGPDWDRKGSKRIHAGDFSRGKCTHKRFQPFSFWTNGSMTDCVYEKSLCSEAGQIVHRDISTKDDRSCQCDFKQKYEVIKTPNNVCFCIPTEEDCSCYHTAYSTNSPISADNSCTNSGIKENQNQNRTDVIISDKNLAGKTEKERIPLRPATSNFKWKSKTDTTILVFFCFMTIFVAGGFFITVLFSKWTSEKMQSFEKYLRRNNTDVLYVRSVLVPKDFSPPLKIKKFTDLTVDESNLVVFHGLTKIVHPIIKKEFNTQCPDHVLNAIRLSISEWDMVSNRRKVGTKSQKERIYLTPDQQRQLFSQTREESENLDLELMIYILKKRLNFEWNKVYIDQLEVIEHIRREIVQSSSGTLTQKRFHDMLNCLTKAVLHLGGETSIEKLLRLHHIENILE